MTPPARPVRPEIIPVFPLPNTVLLPHTTVGLHVFEPRYRRMVEDLLKGQKWLALALLNPAQPEGDTPPVYFEVAGAGYITRSSRLSEDRFHIQVEGLERVRLEEVPSEHPYRLARATKYPVDMEWLGERPAGVALREMLGLVRGLTAEGGALTSLPREPARRLALINQLAARTFTDHRERQRFLEVSEARRRVDLVRNQLRLWRRLTEVVARSPRPKDPEVN